MVSLHIIIQSTIFFKSVSKSHLFDWKEELGMNPSNFQFSPLERIMIESRGQAMCSPTPMISRGSFKVSIAMHKESSFSAVISQQRKAYW